MKIKKYPNGNQYILTPNKRWVRNFTIQNAPFIDINETISSEDHFLFINNEFQNSMNRYPWLEKENFYFPNIIIISDGYGFEEKHKIINKIKNIKNVTIIGVNGSLKKWSCEKNMSFYLTNNPYEECMMDLARVRMPPRCIASCRTNFQFLNNYKGSIMLYKPVNEKAYEGKEAGESSWRIDEYRNPICASIGISYKFGVEKILLMCCDDSFEKERAGSVRLDNGLWTYPQQIVAQEIIDANLMWLKKEKYNEIKIGNFSQGIRYNSAAYIEEADEVINFFEQ